MPLCVKGREIHSGLIRLLPPRSVQLQTSEDLSTFTACEICWRFSKPPTPDIDYIIIFTVCMRYCLHVHIQGGPRFTVSSAGQLHSRRNTAKTASFMKVCVYKKRRKKKKKKKKKEARILKKCAHRGWLVSISSWNIVSTYSRTGQAHANTRTEKTLAK